MSDTVLSQPGETTLTPRQATDDRTHYGDREASIEEDVRIENPPRRPSKTSQATFVRAGYRAPKIVDDPEN